MTSAPAERREDRATPLEYAAWGILALGAWAVLAVAAWLRPDARGYGTHQQLGLPPCQFELGTGVPCPGCGLTTSFALMAHGHVVRAFGAHLMGPVLFAMTLALALYAPAAIVRARPLRTALDARPTLPALTLAVALGLLTFGLRVAHALAARR
jgi:hypothetical protein